MDLKLVVSSSPHIRTPESVQTIMTDVLIALFPATLAGVVIFGFDALITILIGTITAMLTEAIILKKKNIYGDGSAAVTGLLFALTLPPAPPWWLVIFGSAMAIIIGKHVFGGLGNNLFNPALVGRAIVVLSWPVHMTTWAKPAFTDVTTAATPLGGGPGELQNLLFGTVSGCIGETSAIALLLGAIWLFYKGHISWHIPGSFIASAFILAILFEGSASLTAMLSTGLFHVLAGGLLIGALFMATDMVTSPMTSRGQLIFGTGCALITMLIRFFGGFPEGVTFAILLMNGATPLIDNFTTPKKFGGVKK